MPPLQELHWAVTKLKLKMGSQCPVLELYTLTFITIKPRSKAFLTGDVLKAFWIKLEALGTEGNRPYAMNESRGSFLVIYTSASLPRFNPYGKIHFNDGSSGQLLVALRQLSQHVLEELCPYGIPVEIFQKDHNTKFSKISEYVEHSNTYILVLVYSPPSWSVDTEKLFADCLYLLMILAGVKCIRHRKRRLHLTNGHIASIQPAEQRRLKGFQLKGYSLCSIEALEFIPRNLQNAIRIIQPWRVIRTLKLYTINWNSPALYFDCNRSWPTVILYSPPANFFSLFEVFQLPGLLLSVCENLSLKDIQSLRLTCKYFRQSLLTTLPEERMRQFLQRIFHHEPGSSILSDFAELLRRTGSVVGGSAALSILCPGDWTPNDMDLIVAENYWQDIRDFLEGRAQFVLDTEESTFRPGEYGVEAAPPAVRAAFAFTYKLFRSPIQGEPSIDVSIIPARKQEPVSSISPAGQWILTCHSTVVMNFWNGDHLYCLWPDLTFNGLLLRNRYLRNHAEEAFAKYKERGWTDVYGQNSCGRGWLLSSYKLLGERVHLIQNLIAASQNRPLGISQVLKPVFRVPLSFTKDIRAEYEFQSICYGTLGRIRSRL